MGVDVCPPRSGADMKRNLMPLLGVAFAAAVVATGIFYGLLIPRLRTTASADEGQQVVAAARNLDRGAVLRPEDLHLVEAAQAATPPGVVRSIDQVVGLTLLEPVTANQLLTTGGLTRRGATGGASLAIPAGKRAVSIHPAESTGVVAMLRSGSRVDVQVVDTRGTQQLRRLLEDVEVLAVLNTDNHAARPVVTVLVDPDSADRLSLADATLQVRLVLRNPQDHTGTGQRSFSVSALVPAQH